MATGNTRSPSRQPEKSPRASQRAHRWLAGGILAVLALAVIAGALLHAPTPAEAQSAVLISNTGQTAHSTGETLNSTTAKRAQAFTLSASASTAGYTVKSIGIAFHTIGDTSTIGADLTVTLNASSSGSPGNVLCTLSNPSTFSASGVHTFDAPTTGTTCPLLTQNKTYFAVIERANGNTDAISLNTTGSTNEDSGGATGWSIANNSHRYTSSWGSTSGQSHQIEITGNVGPPNNAATGVPGIVDQANPNDSLTTLRPGMTLIAETTGIEDDDGITNPNWMYQWAYWDGTNPTDITGATAITYLLEEKDIGKGLRVKVTFTDDLNNPEGPIESSPTRFVGPLNLIVSNTRRNTAFDFTNLGLAGNITKFAQGFVAGANADSFTLDFIELIFATIGNTATIGDGITVTLNGDSSGEPGGQLCTLANPATFSSSGPHKFYAPTEGISTRCPQLQASTTYHIVLEKDSSYTQGVNITHNGVATTDSGSAIGWTIPDEAQHYTNSAWAENALQATILIDVRARPNFELAELTETEVPFGWSLTPEGVAGGQKFRLMFLTTAEKATSTDIDVYNEFVQAQAAAGHSDIQEHTTQFRVLGSTAAVDARDNTETTSSDTDAPIYWLNGAIVADNYADLYDETWDEEVNRRTAAGDLSTDTDFIWTGSDDDGTERSETGVSVALGETSVRQGELNNSSSTRNPLSALTVTAATNTAPFYALSGIFVVEPNNEATTVNPLTVKSNPRVGDAIYTTLPWRISDPDGTTNAVFQLQWLRYDPATETETEIEGATSQPYFVTHADADHQLSFTITFTDDHGNPEKLVSERTERVLPADVLLRMKPGHDQVDASLDSTTSRYAQKFNTGHIAEGYHLDWTLYKSQ